MDKIQFDRLLKPLTYVYDNIELDLIKNILDSLDNYNNVQGSMKWYLEKLADLGTIDRKNIEVFKKNKAKIKKCLENIVENGSKSSDYLDKLVKYSDDNKLNIDLSNLYQSNSFNKVVKEALKDTYDIADLIQTKALESVREEYKSILNQAYIETASGIYTYQESIRKALDKFADTGITMATYSSGVKIGIEAVVRRDVITRVNKLIGDIDIENTKTLKTNLVYVDQHLGARTRNKYTKNDYEAHAEWQGKVYKIAEYDEKLYPYGSNKDYPDFLTSTGYGEMLGLKGINCYHSFEPFFNWEKVPDQIDLKENQKKYNLLQQQRAYERKIRKLKRKKLVETNPDKKKALNNQLNITHKEFDKFLEDNKLNRDYSREYVAYNKINTSDYSRDETYALNKYFSPYSIMLNEKLRNHTLLTNAEQKIVNDLDSALKKTSNYDGSLVRTLNVENPKDFTSQLEIGKKYKTNQYLSFSSKEGYNDYANIKIYISNSKKGKDLRTLNTIGENEVLYERNIEFKTLNIVNQNDIIYILWEEQ